MSSPRFNSDEDYLASQDPAKAKTLRSVIDLILNEFPELESKISWNVPTIHRNGKYVIGLAAYFGPGQASRAGLVSKSVALSAAFLEVTACVIKTFARVFFIVPLFVLGGTNSSASGGVSVLSGFSTQQLQGLALLLLKVNNQGAAMALAFFGFSTVVNGYLIFRSTFLPRFLGVLGMISGLGWLTFLYPQLGYRAFLFAALIALLSSAVTVFWLLVFGVNEQRWKEQASAAAASIWK